MPQRKSRGILPGSLILLGLLLTGSASAQITGMIENLASKIVPARVEDASASITLEASGELPAKGREIGELSTPSALLVDSPALQKMLGDSPAFIYDPNNRPDPMLIPWTRSNVMFAELNEIATQAVEQKNWQMAQMAYERMRSLGTDSSRAKAEEGLQQMASLVTEEEEARALAIGQPLEAKLPQWILSNTSGVIVDQNQPMCLVGTYILKQGDLVPRQPVDVSVQKIESAAVHYKVLDKIFIVPIREGE